MKTAAFRGVDKPLNREAPIAVLRMCVQFDGMPFRGRFPGLWIGKNLLRSFP